MSDLDLRRRARQRYEAAQERFYNNDITQEQFFAEMMSYLKLWFGVQ